MPSSLELRGHKIHRLVLKQLLEEGIVKEYRDPDGSKFLGLKPSARRALYLLPRPMGLGVERR